jgi:putative transposase
MRKRRYTEVQIVAILKELDAGRPAAELARKHGVHVNTLRLWRSKYGGLDISDLSRLKELESENCLGPQHLDLGGCFHGHRVDETDDH